MDTTGSATDGLAVGELFYRCGILPEGFPGLSGTVPGVSSVKLGSSPAGRGDIFPGGFRSSFPGQVNVFRDIVVN